MVSNINVLLLNFLFKLYSVYALRDYGDYGSQKKESVEGEPHYSTYEYVGHANQPPPPDQDPPGSRRSNLKYPKYNHHYTLNLTRKETKHQLAPPKPSYPRQRSHKNDQKLDPNAAKIETQSNHNNARKNNNKMKIQNTKINKQINNNDYHKKDVQSHNSNKQLNNRLGPVNKQSENPNNKQKTEPQNGANKIIIRIFVTPTLKELVTQHYENKTRSFVKQMNDKGKRVFIGRTTPMKPNTNFATRSSNKKKPSTAVEKQSVEKKKYVSKINTNITNDRRSNAGGPRKRKKVWVRVTYGAVESALGYSPTDEIAEFEKEFNEPGQFKLGGDGYSKEQNEAIDDYYGNAEKGPKMQRGAANKGNPPGNQMRARKDYGGYGEYGGENMGRGAGSFNPGMGLDGPRGSMGPSGGMGLGPGPGGFGPGGPREGPPGYNRGVPPEYGNRPAAGMGPYRPGNGGPNMGNPGVSRYGPDQGQMAPGPGGYGPGPAQMAPGDPGAEIPNYGEPMNNGGPDLRPGFNPGPMGFQQGGEDYRATNPNNYGPGPGPRGPEMEYNPEGPNNGLNRPSPQFIPRQPMAPSGPGMARGRPGFNQGYYGQQPGFDQGPPSNFAPGYNYGQRGANPGQGMKPDNDDHGYTPGRADLEGPASYGPQRGPSIYRRPPPGYGPPYGRGGQFGQPGQQYGYGPNQGFEPRNNKGVNYPGNPAGQAPGRHGPGFRPGAPHPRKPPATPKTTLQIKNNQSKASPTRQGAIPPAAFETENTLFHPNPNDTTTKYTIKYKTTTIDPEETRDPADDYKDYDPFGTKADTDIQMINNNKTESHSTKSEAEKLSSLVDQFNIRPKFAFIDDYQKLKQDKNHGIFTNFVVHLMDILAKKNLASIDRIIASFVETFDRYYTNGSLMALGEPFGIRASDYLKNLLMKPPDELSSLFILVHHTMNDRKLYAPDDLNIYIDFLDKLYSHDDEQAMMDAVHDLYEYPTNRNVTSNDIAENLIKTVYFDKIRNLTGDVRINQLSVSLNTMLVNRFGGEVQVTTQKVTQQRRMNKRTPFQTRPTSKPKILQNITQPNLTLNSTWPQQKNILRSVINDTVGRLRSDFQFLRRTNNTRKKPTETKIYDFGEDSSSALDEAAAMTGTRRLIKTRRSRHHRPQKRSHFHHIKKRYKHKRGIIKKRHRHDHRNSHTHRKKGKTKHPGVHRQVKNRIHKYENFMDRLERGTRETHIKRQPESVITKEDLRHHHKRKHHGRSKHKRRNRHHGRNKHKNMRREVKEAKLSKRDMLEPTEEDISGSELFLEQTKGNTMVPNHGEPEESPEETSSVKPTESPRGPKRYNFMNQALKKPQLDQEKDPNSASKRPEASNDHDKQGIYVKPLNKVEDSGDDSLGLGDSSGSSTFTQKINSRRKMASKLKRRRQRRNAVVVTTTAITRPKIPYPFDEKHYNIVARTGKMSLRKTNASSALKSIKKGIIKRLKQLSKGLVSNFKRLAKNLSVPSSESDENNIMKSNIFKALVTIQDITKITTRPTRQKYLTTSKGPED